MKNASTILHFFIPVNKIQKAKKIAGVPTNKKGNRQPYTGPRNPANTWPDEVPKRVINKY